MIDLPASGSGESESVVCCIPGSAYADPHTDDALARDGHDTTADDGDTAENMGEKDPEFYFNLLMFKLENPTPYSTTY